jgi:hypothetical protein
VIDQLITLVQEKVPAFGRRVLTFEDFLTTAAAEGIVVELKRHPVDEQLIRKPLAKIVLNAGLSERYRTFAGFHAFAHWLGHPGHTDFYLGSPGWLDAIELEASTIGYLAIAPHPKGPPYPKLVRARVDATQLEMEFWIEYPYITLTQGGRTVRHEVRWRSQRRRLVRAGQTEFTWDEGRGDLFLFGDDTYGKHS